MFGKIWAFLRGKKTTIGAGLMLLGKVLEKAGDIVGPVLGVDGETVQKVGTVIEQVGTGVASFGLSAKVAKKVGDSIKPDLPE